MKKAVKKAEAEININTENSDIPDLPDKKLLRVSETANYFGVHERTIRLWIDHGKLIAEKSESGGTVFVTRESIRSFRLMRKIE